MNVPFHQSVSLSVLVPVYNEYHLVETSIQRVLDLADPRISKLEVIIVDDHSSDGTKEVLESIVARDERVKLVRHAKNQGKGAAIRTAIAYASHQVTIIHDADLEYDPRDIPALMTPFIEQGADAVFGSRYLAGDYRRALMFKHSVMNRCITAMSNLFTDLALTDVETCYKAVQTELLKSIPLRSDDFRLEIELSTKLAKRRARVFEVPISYVPRSYEEGKKIGPRDGVLALQAILKYWMIDDLYADDEYGGSILHSMDKTTRFTTWMADQLRPWVGRRVLEIGAGIGTMTKHFIPRDRYVASDINPNYLRFLRSYSRGKPYLDVHKIDATDAEDFAGFDQAFDTIIMLNVLEHLPEPERALKNLYNALEDGGRAIILVPQHDWLYGSLDEALEHVKRYSPTLLQEELEGAGFELESIFDFNRFTVPGWWFSGRVLKRREFSRLQMKIVDTLVPAIRRVDKKLPWGAQSVIAVARRPKHNRSEA